MSIDKAISYKEIERNGDKVRRKNILGYLLWANYRLWLQCSKRQ